jgi:hypothetical protein
MKEVDFIVRDAACCGTSLDFSLIPEGMEKYLPLFLVSRLDALIAKNEKQDYGSQFKSGWALLLVALIFLINGVIMGLAGSWGLMIFQLLVGLTLIFSNSWDLIASRRDAKKDCTLISRKARPMRPNRSFRLGQKSHWQSYSSLSARFTPDIRPDLGLDLRQLA